MTNYQFDNDLYDRQMRTYGLEASSKIVNSSVMIIGLAKGLGTEIGKNLSLCGIKNLYLLDDNDINTEDLKTGYYYSDDNINKNRADILVNKLKELNPNVLISKVNTYKMNQNVTILINQYKDYVSELGEYCRIKNSKLIVLYSGGFSGVIFVDAGINHTINDLTGEIIDSVQIAGISKTGLVKCSPNTTHNFQSNDIIKFENIQGLNINGFYKEWKINVINNTTFQLLDFDSDLDFKIINATAVYINKSVIISHKSLADQILNPSISSSNDIEYSKNLIKTYLQIYNNDLIKNMPFVWSDLAINTFMDNNNIILKDQAKIFNIEIISVVSIMGSLVASEAIKLITNKYTPINQWFTWTDTTLLPELPPSKYNLNSSYSILFGDEFEKKLNESKIFIVGSGAIGCEYLKNFACMNVCNNSVGKIILTDYDHIEKSNLNRQFLFRSSDIGHSKSMIAAKTIKTINCKLNIITYIDKVGSDNINFTNRIFDENLTCVFNALDNINARKFMDDQCFRNNIPLFESGTNGTKGNTQPVIPFITETYSASSDPDNEKTYPICTIKSFPNEIHHVVHWAMDDFEVFHRMPLTINNWLNNIDYLSNLSNNDKSIAIDEIYKFIIQYKLDNIKSFLHYSINLFIENFYTNIKKLLEIHKPDDEISPGVPFWSAGKRCPRPIKLDTSNKLHIDYIESTIHILMNIFNYNHTFIMTELIDDINQYILTINYDKDLIPSENKNEDKLFEINNLNDYKLKSLNPQIFNKDDQSTWHIQWITSSSNLRAINYEIIPESEYNIKGIAGRIIPAIATTTSLVAGLITLEYLKYILNNNSNIYKSTFINLAEPIIIYSDPIDAPIINICGVKINSWNKFEYKINDTTDSYTLKDFKDYYEKLFEQKINMIVLDTCILYADFIQEDLNNKLFDIIKNINNNSEKIMLTIIAEDESIELPLITLVKS